MQLGALIGVSNQALSAIESGKSNPSKQTLISLARVLKNDFNEKWLVEYALGTKDAGIKLYGPPGTGKYQKGMLRQKLEVALNTTYEVHRRGVKSSKGKAAVPLICEITSGMLFFFHAAEDYIIAPAHMINKGKRTFAILFLGEPLRDAFVTAGDVVIMTECQEASDGELILAFVSGKLILRRWSSKGNAVRLTAIDEVYEPIEVPLDKVECLGEVTGLLRFAKNILKQNLGPTDK